MLFFFFGRNFVEEKLGTKYVSGSAVHFSQSYEESSPATPIFFILSPGVDPLKDVETLGKKLGFSGDNNNFWNISLGQGQEIVAERAMDLAADKGHWVILQVRKNNFFFFLSVNDLSLDYKLSFTSFNIIYINSQIIDNLRGSVDNINRCKRLSQAETVNVQLTGDDPGIIQELGCDWIISVK